MVQEGLVVTFSGDTTDLERATRSAGISVDKFNKTYQRAGSGFNGFSKGSDKATRSLIDLSRVAQDAPFGFIAIANNLDPLLDSFTRLRKETGGTGGALKALGASLMGPAGIAVGLSVVSSLLIVFGDDLKKLISTSQKAKIAFADIFTSAAKDSGDDLVRLNVIRKKLNDLSIPAEERIKLIKEYNAVADKTNEIDEKQVNNLTEINKQISKQNTLIQQRALSTAALSKLTEASTKQIELQLEFKEALNQAMLTEEEVSAAAEAQLQNQMQHSQSVRRGLDGMAKSYQNLQQPIKQTTGNTKIVSSALISLFNKVRMGQGDLDRLTESLNGFITTQGLTTKHTQDDKDKKGAFNFFDKFFDFDFNKSELSDKQKAELLEAARAFQRDFGKSLRGLDFYKTTEETSLQAAKTWWANFRKGIVLFKQDAFTNIDFKADTPEVVPLLPKDNAEAFINGIKEIQDRVNGVIKDKRSGVPINENFGVLDDPDAQKDYILWQYERMFKAIGKELPKTFTDSAGNKVEVAATFDFKELMAGMDKLLGDMTSQVQTVSAMVSGVLAPAFSSLWNAIEAGQEPMQSFFEALGQSVKNLINQLIQAAIQAAILALITGGSTPFKGFGTRFTKSFKGLTGMATGGIIPNGFEGDKFPAMLNSGEAVIPLDKIHKYIGGGFGNGNITITGRLRGNDLELQRARTGRSQRRTG